MDKTKAVSQRKIHRVVLKLPQLELCVQTEAESIMVRILASLGYIC